MRGNNEECISTMVSALVEAMVRSQGKMNDIQLNQLLEGIEKINSVIDTLNTMIEDLEGLYSKYDNLLYRLNCDDELRDNESIHQLKLDFDLPMEEDIEF